MPTIQDRLHDLQPGEALHIGHSYLVINLAGVRIVLDPATEDGKCAAPFSNLTLTAHAIARYFRLVRDPRGLIPSAEELAQNVDVVLYSHLHADHFNVALLARMMAANPNLRVFWPQGTPQLLAHKHGALTPFWQSTLHWLSATGWVDGLADGLEEYFQSRLLPVLSLDRTTEMSHESAVVLRESPRLELNAFEVRHPSPLVYIRTPIEEVSPPVLGYQIAYAQEDVTRRVLLIGESSTDPEVLYQIWTHRDELAGIFLPADEFLTTPIFEWLYDAYIHTSTRLMALAERLVGDRATIHGLHQGLWVYTLNALDVELGRQIIKSEDTTHPADEVEIQRCLTETRLAREFSWHAIQLQSKLLDTIGRYSRKVKDKVRLNPVGQPFTFGDLVSSK